jgi:hypothetical protein
MVNAEVKNDGSRWRLRCIEVKEVGSGEPARRSRWGWWRGGRLDLDGGGERLRGYWGHWE